MTAVTENHGGSQQRMRPKLKQSGWCSEQEIVEVVVVTSRTIASVVDELVCGQSRIAVMMTSQRATPQAIRPTWDLVRQQTEFNFTTVYTELIRTFETSLVI